MFFCPSFFRAGGDRTTRMAKQKKDTATIELQRLVEVVLEVPIIGKTPLIPHKWSEKSKQMMPGHPDKEAVKLTKKPKDPVGEATACLYLLNKKYAMPATFTTLLRPQASTRTREEALYILNKLPGKIIITILY